MRALNNAGKSFLLDKDQTLGRPLRCDCVRCRICSSIRRAVCRQQNVDLNEETAIETPVRSLLPKLIRGTVGKGAREERWTRSLRVFEQLFVLACPRDERRVDCYEGSFFVPSRILSHFELFADASDDTVWVPETLGSPGHSDFSWETNSAGPLVSACSRDTQQVAMIALQHCRLQGGRENGYGVWHATQF